MVVGVTAAAAAVAIDEMFRDAGQGHVLVVPAAGRQPHPLNRRLQVRPLDDSLSNPIHNMLPVLVLCALLVGGGCGGTCRENAEGGERAEEGGHCFCGFCFAF